MWRADVAMDELSRLIVSIPLLWFAIMMLRATNFAWRALDAELDPNVSRPSNAAKLPRARALRCRP